MTKILSFVAAIIMLCLSGTLALAAGNVVDSNSSSNRFGRDAGRSAWYFGDLDNPHSFSLEATTTYVPLTANKAMMVLSENRNALIEYDFLNNSNIRVKIISPDGSSRTSSLNGIIDLGTYALAATPLNNGNLFLVYGNQLTKTEPLKYKIVNVAGVAASVVSSGNITTGNVLSAPRLYAATLTNGNVAVSWTDHDPGGCQTSSVYYAVLGSSGSSVKTATAVATGACKANPALINSFYGAAGITAGEQGGIFISYHEWVDTRVPAYKSRGAIIPNNDGSGSMTTIDIGNAGNAPVQIPVGLTNGNYLQIFDDGNQSFQFKIYSKTGTLVNTVSLAGKIVADATVIRTPGNEGFVLAALASSGCGSADIFQYNNAGAQGDTKAQVLPCPSSVFPYGYVLGSGGTGGINVVGYVYNDDFSTVSSSAVSYGLYGVPIVSTSAATDIAATTVTLNGTIDPSLANTTATFQYSTISDLGSSVSSVNATPNTINTGAGTTTITASVSGLSASTTYYFRTKGVNSNGSAAASILSFTTGAGPSTVTITGTLSAFQACTGTASVAQSFSIAGTNLTANVLVTAPAGFEVSSTSGSGYASSITLTQSGGTVSLTTVYIRMASSASGSLSGDIVVGSAGATDKTLAVSGTVNSLPTITLGSIVPVSGQATSFSIPFSATTGSPNQFSLVTGSPRAMSGFTAISNQSFTSSPLAITIPVSAVNNYNFTLTVKNSTTGCVSSAIPVTLTVAPPAPTNITLSATAVNENVAANATVATLSTPQNGTNTFELVSGTGSDDNNAFNISGSALRITNSPDYETKSSYAIRLKVTDAASQSFEKAVTITINNINDAPTVSGSYSFGNLPAGIATTGVAVSTLLSNTNYADQDAGAQKGIAVSSVGTNSGYWQFSLDNGGTYYYIMSASTSAALLLGPTTLIRYSTGVIAETPALTFYAWDMTTGTATTNPSSRQTANVTSGGTAFSTGTATAVVNVTVPTITVSGTLSAFTKCAGSASAPQSFTVSGTDLTGNISVTLPGGVEASTSPESGYGISVSLPQSGGVVSATTVYVRMTAGATGTLSSTLSVASTGATAKTVAVSGSVFSLPTIALTGAGSVSSLSTSFPLAYSATTGSANLYSIATATPTAMSGFTAITDATLASSPLTIPIPASAANTYNFKLNVKNSANGCASFDVPFTLNVFNAPPVISSFSPSSGAPGTQVTITGTGFNTTAANNLVFFGAVKANVNAATATSLTVTVPIGATYDFITELNTGTTLMASSAQQFMPVFTPQNPSLIFAPKVDLVAAGDPLTVAIGDLDGDGKPDMAVTNLSANKVSVYRNIAANGSINASSFAAPVDFSTGVAPFGLAIGDIDMDGKPEIIVANSGSATMSVFHNIATSGSITSSSFASKVDFATENNPYGVAIGDLDGDGKPETVVANSNLSIEGKVSIFRNTSSKGSITVSSFATRQNFATGSSPTLFAIGDLDGDGKPDIAVTNFESGVSVLRNTTTAGSINASSFATKVAIPSGGDLEGMAMGDLDGDGKLDLAFVDPYNNLVSVLRNTASSGSITTGSFASRVDFSTGANSFPVRVAISDLDGDGKPDLVVTNSNTQKVSLFRNTAISGSITTASFAAKIDYAIGLDAAGLSIGDIDGDGKPEVITANESDNTISVLRNGLTPTITSAEYNFRTGVLMITGTNLVAKTGAANDVVISKLTVTGEGNNTYTLTTADVEITDATSFQLTLNATDKAAVAALFNKNGTASADATNYNLAAASDWLVYWGGAADLTGNSITVTGYNHAPAISAGPYTLTDIPAGSVASGIQVSSILTAISFTDVDGSGPSGMAISAKSGLGTWEYSTDNANWTGIGTVSTSSALLLSSTAYVRYTATATLEAATLTVSGWDQSTGTASTNGTRRTTDISENGGATAFSSGTATVRQVVITALATPVGLSATAGDAQNVLSWTANTEATLAGYKIYGGTSASPATLLTTVASGTTFTHTGLTNGTTYYYRISAVDNLSNESGKTADVSAVPKASQVITFNTLSNVTYGAADFDPAATASSALTVSYQSSNTAVAMIVSGKIHVVGAGSTTITASQAGNAAYKAAMDQTQNLVVDKKDITLTLNASPVITKVYNGNTTAVLAAPNYTLVGLEGGDEVNPSGTASYDTKEVGTGKTITVNSFVLSGPESNNYHLTTSSATVTGKITAKSISLTLNASPAIIKVYDASLTATLAGANYALTGVESGDAVTVSGTASYDTKSAGTGKTITAGSFVLAGTQKDNYSLSTASATVTGTITAKPITVTLNATPLIEKIYNGSTAATLTSTNYSLTGVESGDAVAVSGTASYDTKDAGTGKTIMVNSFALSGAQANNYQVSTPSATVTGTITVKTITPTLNTSPSITKVYDGNTNATLASSNYSLAGVEAGDLVGVSGTASYDSKTKGAGKTVTAASLTLNGAQKDNYILSATSATTTGSVIAMPITVTADVTSKTYGETDPAFTYTFTPTLAAGDAFSGTLTRTAGESFGTYAILQGSVTVSPDYSISYVPASLTINKKTIDVTADAKNKTYGAADPSFTYASTPALVTGDAFTGALTRTTGENVGTHAIQQGTLALSSNYILNYTPADLTIGKKTINVNADAKNKTYGDTDPLLTYAFSPVLVTGDAFSGALTRTAGENVGTRSIQQGTLALSSNYTLNYTPADLTIGKKTINVTADTKSKTYGDSDPSLTYVPTPALVTGDAFSGVLTRTAGEHIGNYGISQGTLSLSSNYTLAYNAANLTITKKTITVMADAKTKNYGTPDPALTYTFTPALIAGDAFSGALTRAPFESVGPQVITQGTLSLPADYTIAYASAFLTIAPSPDATLTNLVVSNGELSPVFTAATTNYSMTVSNTVSSVTLTPTPAILASTILVNGTLLPGGTQSGSIPIALGNNTITIAVTAQDGTTLKTYLINVTRNPVSSNADLASLAVSEGTLTPSFDAGVFSYNVNIGAGITSVNFTPTAAEGNAVIKANSGVIASGTLSTISTSGDVTNLSVEVTAQDGVTKKTYAVKFVKPITTWTGLTSNAWTNATNWTNGVPDLTKLTVIANALPRPLVSSSQTIADITVNNDAAATLAANLVVTGNMVNNGTFSGTGSLVFNGNTAQRISGQGSVQHITNNNANGLTIASGAGNTQNVTGILTMNAGTLNTGNNLVLKSTAAGTASVAPIASGASINGLVTAERWMAAQRGYRAFGHPFNTPLPLSQLSDDFSISGSGTGFVTGLGYSTASVSYYDSTALLAAAFKKPLSNAPNTSSSLVWSVGRGILALVRGKGTEGLGGTYPSVDQPSAFAANATGTLNQGNIAYALGANATGTSFNLVGNPYASPINIKLLRSNGGGSLASNNGTSGVASTIYVYNPYKNAGISTTPSQEVRGGLDAYTNDGNTDIIIPAFGAFFVQSKAAGNTINFTETVKAAASAPLAVMGNGVASKLVLSIENSHGSWDDIKLRWDKAAGATGNDTYDGAKMNNELFDAYSISSDKKKLCIDSRSDSFNREEIIPIGIKTNVEDPTFRFRLSAYDLPSDMRVVLRDKLLKTETPLSAVNDSYAFAITSDSLTKGDNRFELAIGFKKVVLPAEEVSAEVKIAPNPFREELRIQLGARARSAQTTHVRLLDMNGRVVRTVDGAPNAVSIRMQTADLAAGVYFVEVFNDGIRVTKQVIKQ
jgi:hypothetical protein